MSICMCLPLPHSTLEPATLEQFISYFCIIQVSSPLQNHSQEIDSIHRRGLFQCVPFGICEKAVIISKEAYQAQDRSKMPLTKGKEIRVFHMKKERLRWEHQVTVYDNAG